MMILLQLDDFITWPLLDILMIIFVSPSIMMIFVYISWQLRLKHKKQQEVAPIDVVSRLTLRYFNNEKLKENEAEECAICLEDYINGEELRVLPCHHAYHSICVDGWLVQHKRFVCCLFYCLCLFDIKTNLFAVYLFSVLFVKEILHIVKVVMLIAAV